MGKYGGSDESKAVAGISSGNGVATVGRICPMKWQMSPPRSRKVLSGPAVVRASPHMWPRQCPGVSTLVASQMNDLKKT